MRASSRAALPQPIEQRANRRPDGIIHRQFHVQGAPIVRSKNRNREARAVTPRLHASLVMPNGVATGARLGRHG
jgi:hypothetical protein